MIRQASCFSIFIRVTDLFIVKFEREMFMFLQFIVQFMFKFADGETLLWCWWYFRPSHWCQKLLLILRLSNPVNVNPTVKCLNFVYYVLLDTSTFMLFWNLVGLFMLHPLSLVYPYYEILTNTYPSCMILSILCLKEMLCHTKCACFCVIILCFRNFFKLCSILLIQSF